MGDVEQQIKQSVDTIIFATLTDTNVFNFFLSKLKKKKVLHTLCHNNKDNIIKVKKKKKKVPEALELEAL